MLKIRRPLGRLIFNMGIAIPGKTVFLIETAPRRLRATISHTCMMTSSNGNIFRVTGPLCREFTGHRWIPRTKASDAELWCFSLISAWINGWVNNSEAGDLRHHRAHYDVSVMVVLSYKLCSNKCPVKNKVEQHTQYLSWTFIIHLWTSNKGILL